MKKYERFINEKFKVYAPLDDNDCSDILEFLCQENAHNKRERTERNNMYQRMVKIAQGRMLLSSTCHSVSDEYKIWQVSTHKHRLLWFYDEGHIIICTHVFYKNKNGRTPPKEIERACNIKVEYFEAKRANQLKFVSEDDEE